MSGSDEPEVKGLTAEIRVLQVGSKPVTLSAARQLDFVDATEIKPFGRVRIDPKPVKGLIEVIGSVDGVLGQILDACSQSRVSRLQQPIFAGLRATASCVRPPPQYLAEWVHHQSSQLDGVHPVAGDL